MIFTSFAALAAEAGPQPGGRFLPDLGPASRWRRPVFFGRGTCAEPGRHVGFRNDAVTDGDVTDAA
jgi:hypothetical protein